MKNNRATCKYSLLQFVGMLLLTIGLIACDSSDDDVEDGANSGDPRATAIEAITRNVGAPVGASGDIADNSSVAGTVGVRAADGSAGMTEEIMNQLEAALEALLSNDVRVGDVITYDPDENALCIDALLGNLAELNGDVEIAECVELFSHITVVLTVLSQNEGTVAIKYDNLFMLLIGYSPSSAYFEMDLAQWKLVVLTDAENNGDPTPELPATFKGVIRLAFAELGNNYGRITLSVEEAINIAGASGGEEISIHVATTPKVIEFTANGQTEAASLEVGLAAVLAMLPIDAADNNSGAVQQGEFDLKGLTLRAELEAGGNELVVTNVGIGAGPFTFNVIDMASQIDPVDLSLELETFGFTIDGSTETVLFDTAFDMVLDINDLFGIFDGTTTASNLSIDVSQNTVLKPLANDVVQVNRGSVIANGNGNFSGAARYTEEQCFTENDSLSTDFPLMDATCPTP